MSGGDNNGPDDYRPGRPLRNEALGIGTRPTLALFPTAQTPTNVTESFFAADDRGVHLVVASATATARMAGRMAAGTRIAGLVSGYAVSTGTAGVVSGGSGLRIQRADGLVISLAPDGANLNVYLWTNKDTFSAARVQAGGSYGRGFGPWWGRLGEDGGGNIVAEVSPDGVSWQTVYSAVIATAWGSGGATTTVGIGIHTGNATELSAVSLHRCTITP